MDKLNDEWIHKFEETDKLYKDFYKDDVYYVKLKLIYINRVNEIEKIKQETFFMENSNTISREEILYMLKRTTLENGIKYNLLSILKYNINLNEDDIKEFLIYTNEEKNYLTIVKNIDDIHFEKTISILQELNDLILIFNEKIKEQSNAYNSTKKIYLHSKTNKKTNKKTIKNKYT